jgi:hypothetical protein
MTLWGEKAINHTMSQPVIGQHILSLWFHKVLQSAHDSVHK